MKQTIFSNEAIQDAMNFAQLDSNIRVYNKCRGFEALRVKDKYDSRFWLDHLTLPQRILSIKMTVKFKQWELDVIKRQALSRIGYNKLQEQIRNVIAKKKAENE